MKAEFIPKPFEENGGECKVCDTRLAFEESLKSESDFLLWLGQEAAGSPELVPVYLKLWPAFADAMSDYRVCFSQNLALYFTAERYGRLRRVPDFLAACDAYKQRALASFDEYNAAVTEFQVASQRCQDHKLHEQVAQLVSLHEQTKAKAQAFWEQIEIWTQSRYQAAAVRFESP